MDNTAYNLFLFIFFAAFTFLLMLFIYHKDFGWTQFMVYTIIYSGFTFVGTIGIMTRIIPITSYQIINLFLIILVLQLFVLFISTPITRKLVCRVPIRHIDIVNL